MDFRTAVKALGGAYTQQDIADALGVSWHSVKQASLPSDSPGHRNPPEGWERALVKLAEKRSEEMDDLAFGIEKSAIERAGGTWTEHRDDWRAGTWPPSGSSSS